MLSSSQRLVDTEDKENLEKERLSLLEFQKEALELLHIKNLKNFDIEKFKKKYEMEHIWMFKDELLYRLNVIDDMFYFLANYK